MNRTHPPRSAAKGCWRQLRWLALLGWLIFTSVWAEEPPPPFTAVYAISLKGVTVGRLTLDFARPDAGHYRVHSRMEATGLARLLQGLEVDETSEGTLTHAGFQPETYQYARHQKKRDKRFGLAFDWAARLVRRTDKPEASPQTLAPHTLDKAVLLPAIMRDLSLKGQMNTVLVADDDRVKTYALERVEAPPLTFVGRSMEVVVVSYGNPDSGRRTQLWCAPALGFVPLRIEYRERDGKITRGTLQTFEHLPP